MIQYLGSTLEKWIQEEGHTTNRLITTDTEVVFRAVPTTAIKRVQLRIQCLADDDIIHIDVYYEFPNLLIPWALVPEVMEDLQDSISHWEREDDPSFSIHSSLILQEDRDGLIAEFSAMSGYFEDILTEGEIDGTLDTIIGFIQQDTLLFEEWARFINEESPFSSAAQERYD